MLTLNTERSYLKTISISLICFFLLCGCNLPSKDPGTVLDNARQQVKNGAYSEALKNYVWFFKNSIEIEPAMFGVKHSYCVDEWRKLGEIYEPALLTYREELLNRQEKLLNGSESWELFMEFDTLCQYDGKKNEVIKVFMLFHKKENQNKDFVESIFNPIKEDLLALGHYNICSEYTKDATRKADQIIHLHRLNIEFEEKSDNKCDNMDFAEKSFIIDANYLLTVLKKTNRIEEFNQVKNKLVSYNPSEELKKLLIGLDNK